MTYVIFTASGLLAWCYGTAVGGGLFVQLRNGVLAVAGAVVLGTTAYGFAQTAPEGAVYTLFVLGEVAVLRALVRSDRDAVAGEGLRERGKSAQPAADLDAARPVAAVELLFEGGDRRDQVGSELWGQLGDCRGYVFDDQVFHGVAPPVAVAPHPGWGDVPAPDAAPAATSRVCRYGRAQRALDVVRTSRTLRGSPPEKDAVAPEARL